MGVLRDAVRCTVTEERNGAFELEMVYPITGQYYSSLALRGLILAKPNPYGDAQYFRIYKISRPINGQVTVNAQHISYDLSGIPVGPCKALNAVDALQQLKSHAAISCDYTFWTDIQTVADFAVAVPGSLRSLLGGVEGSVLDVYGGEYEWDNTTVKLHSQRGTDRGVTIRYGKNLTDLTQEESCAEVYTGVFPYWVDSDGNVTQITGNPVVNVPDGKYDFVRVLTLDVSQDIKEQPTAAQLRQAALDYIAANKVGVPKVKVPYRALVRIGYRGYGTGALMKDEQFNANLAGAKANNKLLGFYFFSQAITVEEAREEADFCASLAPTGYPLFFDSEWGHTTKTGVHDGRADNLTKDQRTAIAMAFCGRAKAHGFTTGIYTFTAFAGTNIDYTYLCEDYIGWLADTRTNYDKTLPRHIHQYGQGGVAGIAGVVDLNHLVKAMPAADKPANKLQVITVGPVSQGDADAIYLLCKERGLTDAGLYKSEWAEV